MSSNEMMSSEDRNVAVDLGAVTLCDALADPDDVATLLLLQLDERVEDAEVELLHERVLHQQHLHMHNMRVRDVTQSLALSSVT